VSEKIFHTLADEALKFAIYYEGQAAAYKRVAAMGAVIPDRPADTPKPAKSAPTLGNRKQPQRAVLEVFRLNPGMVFVIGEIISRAKPLGHDLTRQQVGEVLKRLVTKQWVVRQGAGYQLVGDYLQMISHQLEIGNELDL
jgi:hypothetical protein